MNLAGIELRYLVNTMDKMSAGYYVSNIFNISRGGILFKLHHTEKPDIFMMVSVNGIWLTDRRIDAVSPNRLLRRLRGDLIRARLAGISQAGAERIAYIKFSNFEKEYVLVAEMFGDGNLVLCNSDMKILALLHSVDVRHRNLAVGGQYALPPSNSLDIFGIGRADFDSITDADMDAVRWIGRNLGFPKKYAEIVFQRAGIDPKTNTQSLQLPEIDALYNATRILVDDVSGGNHDAVILRPPDGPPEIYPVSIRTDMPVERPQSFMAGLDIMFTEDIVSEARLVQTSATDKKIREYQSQLDEQDRAIETVMRRSRQIGIVARQVMDCAASGITINDESFASVLKRHEAGLVSIRGMRHICILDEKIRIDPNSSLYAIGSTLFDEAKRQANAVSAIEAQKLRTRKKLDAIDTGGTESPGFHHIVKRTWFQRYRWFFTSDGIIAVGGRDSSSNSAVVRKHMEKNDRVFHAEIFGSPFFILKDSAAASPSSLNEVAHATVCFSRAWRGQVYGMGAFWVSPEQVKKAAPSGQFLPRGSFIIDGQRNFVKISSLRLAVGIIRYNDSYLATCGPPDPIKKQSACYAVIEPSAGDMAEAGKRIRHAFLQGFDNICDAIPLDEFIRILPAGGSHIVHVDKGDNAGIQ